MLNDQEALKERSDREVPSGHHCDSDSGTPSAEDNTMSPAADCGSCGDERNTPRSGSDSLLLAAQLGAAHSGPTLIMDEEEEEEELQWGRDCPERLEEVEGEALTGKNLSHNRKERER